MTVPTRPALALALLVLGWIAWRVLSLGIADHLAEGAPARALSWRGDHPVALVELALQEAEPSRAAALARAALAANPLEGRAYRALGRLADGQGKQALATNLYEIAAARAPRDLPSRLWLERHYLAAGQVRPALRHLDLSLRVEPGLRTRQFPVLAGLAGLPSARAALADALASRPLWRPEFVEYLCQQGTDSHAVDALLARLAAAPDGLAPRESATWVERLLRESRWNEAYLVWTAALGADGRARLGNVFDGGFERESDNFGFDWRTEQAPGSTIEWLPMAGAAGKLALRVGFDQTRLQSGQPRQLLLLAPGDYVLSGRARAEELRSGPGLAWQVSCAGSQQRLAATAPVAGTSPWQRFSAGFAVPSQGCAAQWLTLGVLAQAPSEQLVSGDAWFDELAITRAVPARPPVARVSALLGAPLLMQAERFAPLRPGQAVFAGDRLLLPRSGAVRLLYADGCSLALGPSSLLQVPAGSPCAGTAAAVSSMQPARFENAAGDDRNAASVMAALAASLSGRPAEEAADDRVGV